MLNYLSHKVTLKVSSLRIHKLSQAVTFLLISWAYNYQVFNTLDMCKSQENVQKSTPHVVKNSSEIKIQYWKITYCMISFI